MNFKKKYLLLAAMGCLLVSAEAQTSNETKSSQAPTSAKRKIQPSDVYRLHTLGDPQVSPEGNWIAYTLSSVDSAQNKRNTDIWMVSWDGKQNLAGAQMANTFPLFLPVMEKPMHKFG